MRGMERMRNGASGGQMVTVCLSVKVKVEVFMMNNLKVH
jgi:hypothetical protein